MEHTVQWLELKDDMVREICRHLVCRLDRVRMAETCPRWKAAIDEEKALLDVLPVQYFPRSIPPSLSCISCVDGCRLHLPAEMLHSRMIGSPNNGWLLVARELNWNHYLCDIRTSDWIKVPDQMKMSRESTSFLVIIHSAAVSDVPSCTVPPQLCYGAALVTRLVPELPRGSLPDIMLWRLSDDLGWGSQEFLLDAVKDSPADIICYNTMFHFLNKDEQIIVVTPSCPCENQELETEMWPLTISPRCDDNLQDFDQPVARYLVESRGKLLLVRRYKENGLTIFFRIFQLKLLRRGESHDRDHWLWEEISLDGRMIFLAFGCSRSFDVKDYPDFPNACEGIYFKGDVDQVTNTWREMDYHQRFQLMNDTGRWTGPPPGQVLEAFKMATPLPQMLPHSAPVWVLPK